MASGSPIDAAAPAARVAGRQGEEDVLVGADAVAFAGGAPVLTDDYAPVDQWLARAQLR